MTRKTDRHAITAVCGLGHQWPAVYTSTRVRAARGPGRRGGWTRQTSIEPAKCPTCGHQPAGPQLPANVSKDK